MFSQNIISIGLYDILINYIFNHLKFNKWQIMQLQVLGLQTKFILEHHVSEHFKSIEIYSKIIHK